MSQVFYCDICSEPTGLDRARLHVVGPVHPHKGESISQSNGIDVCVPCLKAIPDLSTSETLENLKLREGKRGNAQTQR